MKLKDVKTDADFERYLDYKEIESHDQLCAEMGIGEVIDENGEETSPDMWYWRGVSPEMNEDIG